MKRTSHGLTRVKLCQIGHFVVVEAARDDAVEFDRVHTDCVRGFDAAPYVVEIPAPGDLPEPIRPQAVDADVDLAETGAGQRRRKLAQSDPIGRHGDPLYAGDRPDRTHQFNHAAADSRLAAGQTDLVHTQACRDADQGQDFGILQEHGRRAKSDILWHAIDTAQVAGIGQRYPKVVQMPTISIVHGRGGVREGYAIFHWFAISADHDPAASVGTTLMI